MKKEESFKEFWSYLIYSNLAPSVNDEQKKKVIGIFMNPADKKIICHSDHKQNTDNIPCDFLGSTTPCDKPEKKYCCCEDKHTLTYCEHLNSYSDCGFYKPEIAKIKKK